MIFIILGIMLLLFAAEQVKIASRNNLRRKHEEFWKAHKAECDAKWEKEHRK